MEVYVKIFNNELVKIFDTSIDKKKQVILTTVSDFQKEAEADFYINNNKIKTLIFKNLQPARARILDLPIIVEAIHDKLLCLSYTGEDNTLEKHTIKLVDYTKLKKILKTILLIIIALAALGLLTFSFIYFIPKLFNNNNVSNITTVTENSSVPDDNKNLSSLTSSSSSESSKSIYTLASLKELIGNNTPLYFKTDKADFLNDETAKLSNMINYLKNYKKVNLNIKGHTESIGLPKNEMELSIKRSETVKKYLISNSSNIELNITTKGFGATTPAKQNAATDKQYLNRRVEITVESAE